MDNQTGIRILYACCEFLCDLNLCAGTPADLWFVEAGGRDQFFEEITEQNIPGEDKILARGRVWRPNDATALSRVDLRIGYGASPSYHFVMGVRSCKSRRFQLENSTIRSWLYIKENTEEGFTVIPSPGVHTDVEASRNRCDRYTCDCGDYIQERIKNIRFLRRCPDNSKDQWEVMSAWEISNRSVAGLSGYAHTTFQPTTQEA